MKRVSTLLSIMILFVAVATGQEQVSAKVTTGEDLNAVFAQSRYLFQEFQDARVILSNGAYQAKMNYNALSGEMEFISDNGETLTLGNIRDVRAIIFGNRTFVYAPKGYMEVLSGGLSNCELLAQRRFQIIDRKKEGAYGTYSGTTSIDSYSSVGTDSGYMNLASTQEVTYKRTNDFYLEYSGKYLIANKSGFKKVFRKYKPDLENYLTNHPVNFSKEEDVIRFFAYCIE